MCAGLYMALYTCRATQEVHISVRWLYRVKSRISALFFVGALGFGPETGPRASGEKRTQREVWQPWLAPTNF